MPLCLALFIPVSPEALPIPPSPPSHEQHVREHPIRHHAEPQGHEIESGICLQVVEAQYLLSSADGTLSVRKLLSVRARKADPRERIGSKVSERPFDGGEMVERL